MAGYLLGDLTGLRDLSGLWSPTNGHTILYLRNAVLSHDRGTALGAMMVVLTLTAVLALGVLRLVAWRSAAAYRETCRLQAQYAAESGIEDARWRFSRSVIDSLLHAHLTIPDITDSLAPDIGYRVRVQPYGGYLEAVSTGRSCREKATIRVLLGMRQPDWFQRAVTLRPSPYPLVMAGDSRIRGDVLAGLGGIRTGRIPGDPPPPKTPAVEGEIRTQGEGATFDPLLFNTTMTALDRHLEGEGITHTDLNMNVFGVLLNPHSFPDSLRGAVIHLAGVLVQFTAKPDDPPLSGPLTLVADGGVRLEGDLKLHGRVVIAARDSIRVGERVDIRGGLLYSPGPIRLVGAAVLEGQALSRSRIIVEDQAQTRYPAVLFATGRVAHGRREGGVAISSDRRQTGSLVMPSDGLPNRAGVFISRNSSVAGMVYSANHLWLAGELLGAATTGAFYHEQGPTTYINWLKDGVINRPALTDAFRLPLFFSDQARLEIVEWEWIDH